MAGLTLFLLGPTGVKHAVDVTPDASVGTLAEEAARVFDVPVASVRLSWQGRELGDRREALADAGVCNQSMLEVQTRRIRFVECGAHLEIQGDYHVGNCDEGHSWCKTDYCFTVPDDLDQRCRRAGRPPGRRAGRVRVADLQSGPTRLGRYLYVRVRERSCEPRNRQQHRVGTGRNRFCKRRRRVDERFVPPQERT
eukprot:TRINITY_DN1186_c0_g1_i1.p1 TRINITY_DN1186_c0_g1~~TRINITY_DN1186_c0_g1_i1.p1  ORF type:complete len:196 (+),score=8.05 TRINITY_DN1186_c0_g1_i1:59-646(+)